MLRVSPDGRRLLAVPSYRGSSAPPAIVDLDSGAARPLTGPQVYTAHWTTTGILTAHADGAARLWDSAGHLLRVFQGGRGFLADVALTARGEAVGASSDGTLRFWDAATARQLWSPTAPVRRPLGVYTGPWGIVARGDGGELSRWVLPDVVIEPGKASGLLTSAGGMVTP
jgi:hypothetical protein